MLYLWRAQMVNYGKTALWTRGATSPDLKEELDKATDNLLSTPVSLHRIDPGFVGNW